MPATRRKKANNPQPTSPSKPHAHYWLLDAQGHGVCACKAQRDHRYKVWEDAWQEIRRRENPRFSEPAYLEEKRLLQRLNEGSSLTLW